MMIKNIDRDSQVLYVILSHKLAQWFSQQIFQIERKKMKGMTPQNYSQTLFFSLSQQDFQTSLVALENGANPNLIFELTKGQPMSSTQLCIKKCAQYGYKKGPMNSKYKSAMNVLKSIITKSTVQCKCLKEHKCPLYIALETFKITNEKEILQGKCELIRYLIIHGADIRFEPKQDQKAKKIIGKWSLRWFDFEGIRSYLITKQFTYVETQAEL